MQGLIRPSSRQIHRRLLLLAWAAPLLLLCAGDAWAGIYTCVDKRGRKLTSDRPIAECTGTEQQMLNRDGSVRTVLPPTLTAEEKLAKETRERAENEARLARLDATRRDRNLVARYPDEVTHQRARESALDSVRLAVRATQARLRDLAQQRQPLLNEMEFYQGKKLPPKLKNALDANDAAMDAQKSAAANQAAEMDRINSLYDAELERLRRLWAGAAPGTLSAKDQAMLLVPATSAPANKPGR